MSEPPKPIHVPGMRKGEEAALNHHEAGRAEGGKNYRSSRDSTGINAADRAPIHPDMPSIPPA